MEKDLTQVRCSLVMARLELPNLSPPLAYPDTHGDTPGHDEEETAQAAKFFSKLAFF